MGIGQLPRRRQLDRVYARHVMQPGQATVGTRSSLRRPGARHAVSGRVVQLGGRVTRLTGTCERLAVDGVIAGKCSAYAGPAIQQLTLGVTAATRSLLLFRAIRAPARATVGIGRNALAIPDPQTYVSPYSLSFLRSVAR